MMKANPIAASSLTKGVYCGLMNAWSYQRIKSSGPKSWMKLTNPNYRFTPEAAMYYDLKSKFWLTKMKKQIAAYVARCDNYCRVKAIHMKPTSLLQSLSTPKWKWEEISMDFITGLPITQKGNDLVCRHLCRRNCSTTWNSKNHCVGPWDTIHRSLFGTTTERFGD